MRPLFEVVHGVYGISGRGEERNKEDRVENEEGGEGLSDEAGHLPGVLTRSKSGRKEVNSQRHHCAGEYAERLKLMNLTALISLEDLL